MALNVSLDQFLYVKLNEPENGHGVSGPSSLSKVSMLESSGKEH